MTLTARLMEKIFIAALLMTSATAKITVENHGYKGVVVSISADVPEDPNLLTQLESMLTNASAVLFRATKYQLYFKEIIIIVPQHWTSNDRYKAVSDEALEAKGIVVDMANEAVGNTPYTFQDGGCGQEGQYIHLTPDYILKNDIRETFGPSGKVMVHEWGHFRWGLFDEYAKHVDEQFYRLGNEWFPTRCDERVDGQLEPLVKQPDGKGCTLDLDTGVPDANCVFVPFPDTGAVSSLMFSQRMDNVVEFCDNPVNGPENQRHNALAPSRQNKLCKNKSAWEIMRLHDDFIKLANTDPLPVTTITNPTFRRLKVQPRARVLVLDVSGSMGGTPLEFMWQAMSNFILSTVNDGSYLGIVRFSTTADVLFDLTQVNTEEDRFEMVNALPTQTISTTSIGSGLKLGLKVLSDAGYENGGSLLLVTDGKENASPQISDVIQSILDRGVVVSAFAFGQKADANIGNIARLTRGKIVFYNGGQTSTSLIDGFDAAVSTTNSMNHGTHLAVSVHTNAGDIQPGVPFIGTFDIDSTLGKQTSLTFSYRGQIEVDVINPQGVAIATKAKIYSSQVLTSKVLNIMPEDDLPAALWTYRVKANATTSFLVSIKSKPRGHNSDVIQTHAWLANQETIKFDAKTTLAFHARVTRGKTPVLNASVAAIIERPSGDNLHLNLYDNGIGSDLIKDDGVYSTTLLARDLTGDGRYNIKIKVLGTEKATRVLVGGSEIVGTAGSRRNLSGASKKTEPLGDFQRVTTAGEFRVRGFNRALLARDELPPARVRDFRSNSFDSKSLTATLAWTAVGGDADRGRADHYIFYVSDDPKGFLNSTQTLAAPRFAKEDIVVTQGNLSSPRAPGQREEFTVVVKALAKQGNANETVYISVVAMDAAGNQGDPSNVVTVSRAASVSIQIVKSTHTSIHIVRNGSTTNIHKSIHNNRNGSTDDINTSIHISVHDGINTTYLAVGVSLGCLVLLTAAIFPFLIIRAQKRKRMIYPANVHVAEAMPSKF